MQVRLLLPAEHSSQALSLPRASALRSSQIESVGAARPDVEAAIQKALSACLTDTNLGVGKKYKVRRGGGLLCCSLQCYFMCSRLCWLLPCASPSVGAQCGLVGARAHLRLPALMPALWCPQKTLYCARVHHATLYSFASAR